MSRRSGAVDEAQAPGAASPCAAANRLGPTSLIVLSAWCGLVAGLLEVATIVLRKRLFDSNQLYGMSRHFVWLIPLSDLGIFVALGAGGCIACWVRPRGGRWFFLRALAALVFLPVFLIALPRVYAVAWLAVTLGLAAQVVPRLERSAQGCRRFVRASLPMALGVLAVLAASPWISDRLQQLRASARAMPPQGSPNVLLIVLDTVAAGHLSLYGYERATSTTLTELAERGIRFDRAQSPSSWTLPSHASMFTGRWLHELSAGWLSPLDEAHPTLAEFLDTRGYATAGFIANTTYCARDSGLARGFTYYRDFIFPDLTALRTAVLINRALPAVQTLVQLLDDRRFARFRSCLNEFWRLFVSDRKGAAMVNREFLAWLAGRTQPERPFFAFINYFDAHCPYRLPPGRMRRFGVAPTEPHQRGLIQHWANLDKSRLAPRDVTFAALAYDDCIADLDEQLGKLLDELGQRGVLEQTWLLIASDHGESFGEHADVFCHGTSLYQTELHVPLLIIPPGGSKAKQVVAETVSLRDLPATIADVLGQKAGSPFPGNSLARFWKEPSATAAAGPASSEPVLAEVVPGDTLHVDDYGFPLKTWPLGAVHEGEWSYIRDDGRHSEELFHVRGDAREAHNLAGDPAARLVLERMRTALDRLTVGPLLPQRFKR